MSAPGEEGALGTLAAEIREAETRLAILKSRTGAATCADMGEHDWRQLGGRNAGCSDECCCSVPVYECSRCGDCDYGDSAEAVEVRHECADDVRHEEDREARIAAARTAETPRGR